MRKHLDKLAAIALTGAAALSLGAIAPATGSAAAEALAGGPVPLEPERTPLRRSLEVAETQVAYERVYRQAKRLDVAPPKPATRGREGNEELERKLKTLREEVEKARRERREPEATTGAPESVGVSTATLEAIAACESGGDPTAISPSGTYRGKYQFASSTWASVGGSGDPAGAPETEQDYRAALLYSQSGSSPWPVCG